MRKSKAELHLEHKTDRSCCSGRSPNYRVSTVESLIGSTFGKLTITKLAGFDKYSRAHVECSCECGRVIVSSLLSVKHRNQGCGSCEAKVYGKYITQTFWGRLVRGAEVRGIPVTITPEMIDSLFDEQHGLCALSGLPIKISRTIHDQEGASLDRIDSSRGYEPGNAFSGFTSR